MLIELRRESAHQLSHSTRRPADSLMSEMRHTLGVNHMADGSTTLGVYSSRIGLHAVNLDHGSTPHPPLPIPELKYGLQTKTELVETDEF